jgi:hypothetical protein
MGPLGTRRNGHTRPWSAQWTGAPAPNGFALAPDLGCLCRGNDFGGRSGWLESVKDSAVDAALSQRTTSVVFWAICPTRPRSNESFPSQPPHPSMSNQIQCGTTPAINQFTTWLTISHSVTHRTVPAAPTPALIFPIAQPSLISRGVRGCKNAGLNGQHKHRAGHPTGAVTVTTTRPATKPSTAIAPILTPALSPEPAPRSAIGRRQIGARACA